MAVLGKRKCEQKIKKQMAIKYGRKNATESWKPSKWLNILQKSASNAQNNLYAFSTFKCNIYY